MQAFYTRQPGAVAKVQFTSGPYTGSKSSARGNSPGSNAASESSVSGCISGSACDMTRVAEADTVLNRAIVDADVKPQQWQAEGPTRWGRAGGGGGWGA